MSSSAAPPAPQVAEKSHRSDDPLHADTNNPDTAEQPESASAQSGGVGTSASEHGPAVDAPFDADSFRTYKDYLHACKKRKHVTPKPQTMPFPNSVALPSELRKATESDGTHGVPYRNGAIIVRKEGHAILVCEKERVTLISRNLRKSTQFHCLELFVKDKMPPAWSHAYVGSFLPSSRSFPFNPETIDGFSEMKRRPDLKRHWRDPNCGYVFIVLHFVRFNTGYLNALRDRVAPPDVIPSAPPSQRSKRRRAFSGTPLVTPPSSTTGERATILHSILSDFPSYLYVLLSVKCDTGLE